MREIEKRLRVLEAVGKNMDDAFLTVTLRDGTRKKMLWCDALIAAINDRIVNVEADSSLGELVRIMMI